MNKNDLVALAVLIGLLFLWTGVGPVIERQFFPPPPVPELAEPPTLSEETEAPPQSAPAAPAAAESIAAASVPPPPTAPRPERTEVLANDVIELTFSNHGASISHAELREYRETQGGEELIEFDFASRRPLSMRGLTGFEETDSFDLRRDETTGDLVFTATSPAGLTLTRRIALDEGYLVRVSDVFSNHTDRARNLPGYELQLGEMGEPEGEATAYGVHYVGVDALVHGGKGVKYFGKDTIPKTMKNAGKDEMEDVIPEAVDWVAVKNRFFTQILTPENGGDAIRWYARGAYERGFFGKSLVLEQVAASMQLPSLTLEPGQAHEQVTTFYIGPKKYTVLHQFGRHQEDVMDFGRFAPICKVLLLTLNFIHDHIWPHNYGMAIMLLTVIIRILFWPITHKGTDSMRRMQDIQPLLKELQAKHKDDPQKLNAEMMKLYKEHKVNPMMGCLPMLVQIPVFLALFVVLRSAIELRYAGFLWISDLSRPEDLFATVLPFGGLRILPILYAVSMLLQQKIMPMSGGNPQQEKIMQFMPIMMLFIFYGFASGLVLYWITNQALMLTQQYFYQRRKKRAEVGA